MKSQWQQILKSLEFYKNRSFLDSPSVGSG